MNRALKPVLDNLLTNSQAEFPTLTLYKMCIACMNNDWTMIFSSLLTLFTTVAVFMMHFSK